MEPLLLDAGQLLAAFAARDLSPREVMQAAVDQAERHNPGLNFIAAEFFGQALAEAGRAEERYMRGEARPLEGLPLAVKDEMPLAGTPRSSGSLIFRDRQDKKSCVYVQRLLDAGAIPLCKTTVPEFCILGVTHSRLYGVTRNPWNRELSSGGSSGGSAVALAVGAASLATGSDIGGSIRIPASCCGVAGFKPPYGRNPDLPVYNLDYYAHSGPMARSVADCVRMQNVTSGQHMDDIASLREDFFLDPEARADIRGWKIAYSTDLGLYEVDDEVRRRFGAATEIFRELGAELHEVEFTFDQDCLEMTYAYLDHLAGADVARMLAEHRELMTDTAIAYGEASAASTSLRFFAANEMAVKTYAAFMEVMRGYRLLLTPTLAIPAPPATWDWDRTEVTFNGRSRNVREAYWAMTVLFNMLSRCPALSVPAGMSACGVPVGLQIISHAYHDHDALLAGMAYERAAQSRVDGIWPDFGLFARQA